MLEALERNQVLDGNRLVEVVQEQLALTQLKVRLAVMVGQA